MTIKEKLVQKIQKMEGSDWLLNEAYDFIQYLEQREEDRALTSLSERSFNAIMDNTEDDALRYPLRGKSIRYDFPFEPVGDSDWSANQ